MKQFEYTERDMPQPLKGKDREIMLQEMGQQGWELVQVLEGTDGYCRPYYYFIFKRAIEEAIL